MDPKLAELGDLNCDSESKDRSVDQGASLALPYLRYRARFAAHKESVGLAKRLGIVWRESPPRLG